MGNRGNEKQKHPESRAQWIAEVLGRLRKGCLFMGETLASRVSGITAYADFKETSCITLSWDERERGGSLVQS